MKASLVLIQTELRVIHIEKSDLTTPPDLVIFWIENIFPLVI